MRDEIVLIGPVGAGKTTVASILAQRLGVPHAELDQVTWDYATEYGYGPRDFRATWQTEGFLEADRRVQPALAYALERFLGDSRDCVLDLGAGHAHFVEPDLAERARRALGPFRNVVLLLPSADLSRSVEILEERNRRERGGDWIVEGADYFKRWVCDPAFSRLATITVYTDGKTPEQTADEVLDRLR